MKFQYSYVETSAKLRQKGVGSLRKKVRFWASTTFNRFKSLFSILHQYVYGYKDTKITTRTFQNWKETSEPIKKMLIPSIICHSVLLVSFPETAFNNILRTSSDLRIKPLDLLRINDTKQVLLTGYCYCRDNPNPFTIEKNCKIPLRSIL